jgi:hypothetical protein
MSVLFRLVWCVVLSAAALRMCLPEPSKTRAPSKSRVDTQRVDRLALIAIRRDQQAA